MEGRGGRDGGVATEGVKLAKRLRVISPEDFSIVKDTPITLVSSKLSLFLSLLFYLTISFYLYLILFYSHCNFFYLLSLSF